MTERKAVVEHVQIVRHHADEPAENRAIVVFDTDTGRRIGHSPHCKVEQTEFKKSRGVITTTLKITPVKGK